MKLIFILYATYICLLILVSMLYYENEKLRDENKFLKRQIRKKRGGV